MVTTRRVAIVVDSSSCLPLELLGQWEIFVVPHQLVIGGASYRDNTDISPAQFYRHLKTGSFRATTSAPGPAAFLEAFKTASVVAKNILCLTVSSNFSATNDAAHLASEIAQEVLPEIRVEVLDSQSAAGALGFITLEAARAAFLGCNLEEVCFRSEKLIPRIQILATLDTLHYIDFSGRLSKAKLWVGSTLGIKPLLEFRNSKVSILERPRSRQQSVGRMFEIIKRRVGYSRAHVNVMEAAAPDEAEELRLKLKEELNCVELFISQFTPVMGSHTGPGLLGIAFYTEIE